MRFSFGAIACCALVSISCLSANAVEMVDWHVVLSGGTLAISQPPLPATRGFSHAGLGNFSAGLLGFQISPSSGYLPTGNWFQHGSIFTQYAALNTAGVLGPGRTGAESADVFRRLYYGDSIGSGTFVFGATASDPSTPMGDATAGLWLWNGSSNVEIARVGNDGNLGPGLGSGVFYKSLHNTSSQDDIDVRMLSHGRVLFSGFIGTDSTLGSNGLSVHVPGHGNHPCMLPASTDSNYGPGIIATFSGVGANVTVSPQGQAYDFAIVTATTQSPPGFYGASGIWQFCDGPPQLAVLTNTTTEYGPHLGDSGAIFGGDLHGLQAQIAPSQPGSFYFTSGGKYSNSTSFLGLFHHDAALGRNQPILIEGQQGALGPQIVGYTFKTNTVPYEVLAAGNYAVLHTTIVPAGASGPFKVGLWRITGNGSAQPVAIAGDTGSFAAAHGRVWTGGFYKYTIFDNGDIVTLAETQKLSDSSTALSWWRLGENSTPVEILKVGDIVQVPTSTGMVSEPVTAITTNVSLALPPSAGRDVWFTANGNILVDGVTVQGYENVSLLLSGMATHPDYIFSDGFQ